MPYSLWNHIRFTLCNSSLQAALGEKPSRFPLNHNDPKQQSHGILLGSYRSFPFAVHILTHIHMLLQTWNKNQNNTDLHKQFDMHERGKSKTHIQTCHPGKGAKSKMCMNDNEGIREHSKRRILVVLEGGVQGSQWRMTASVKLQTEAVSPRGGEDCHSLRSCIPICQRR